MHRPASGELTAIKSWESENHRVLIVIYLRADDGIALLDDTPVASFGDTGKTVFRLLSGKRAGLWTIGTENCPRAALSMAICSARPFRRGKRLGKSGTIALIGTIKAGTGSDHIVQDTIIKNGIRRGYGLVVTRLRQLHHRHKRNRFGFDNLYKSLPTVP